MDDVKDQVASNPDAAADQATPDTPAQAPSAPAEGTSSAAAENEVLTPPADAQTTLAPTQSAPTQAEPAEAGAAQASESAPDTPTPNTSDNLTMEDVMAASDDQLSRPPVHRGMTVTGSIIMMGQDGIVVDVGAKIEGTLPYNQLFEFETTPEEAKKYFKPGDEITVYVIRSDVPNNQIILSKKRADAERAWNLLQEIYDKKLPVEVEVVEKVRGGLVANLGVRAFLPASQVDVRRINDLAPYVGKRLKVKIIELNRKRNRVIVSRRAVIEEEMSGVKEETLKKLEPGLQLEGEVVEVTDFGVFVNLGGIDGLVHRSELTHGRFNHPKEVVELGQKVKVEVLDMDLERERINLSMKKLVGNPWEEVLLSYSIGQKIEGKVTNLTQFGAFVEIEPGLEGLIHVSEMSWTKRIRHPKEVLSEGEDVEAMILKIDAEAERISLGLRQTQPDPWSSLPDRFPPGTEVTGPITGITEFGVFMEIEEGIEGLVHISELAHEHIDDITEHFNKGDEISAVILNIDPVEQRASLSRKRLLPYTSDMSSVPTGAPSARSGGRKGRRGGRRSQGIDYDYSYAATDSGSKATTKLGDVYADLFAQFGLADSSDEDESAANAEANISAAKPETSGETSAEAGAETAAETKSEDAASAAASSATETPEVEAAAETLEQNLDTSASAEEEGDVDPENAIDAAEAAALLTAAFREGKRPPASETGAADSASAGSAEASNAEASASESAASEATSASAETAPTAADDGNEADASEASSGSGIDYDKYIADVKTYAPDADEGRIRAIVDSMKGVLGNRDAMLVACSQKDELEHVRERFLKAKLNRSESDEELDAAIQSVCETMSETRNKSRVTFYYLLTDKLGAQDYWS